jgi:hypothetical protein
MGLLHFIFKQIHLMTIAKQIKDAPFFGALIN